VGGLTGIDAFSHLIVLYWLHGARYDRELHVGGVFARRSKERPNALGLSVVELLTVDDDLLTVRGLDAVDGSPVIDIKPYIPATDAIALAVTPTGGSPCSDF
jgi:tRNA-Thr(GGU) m(6)t(6)A37 methyltransferase TsaA